MALRACSTRAGQIDAVLAQLRQQLETLKGRGTLVKNTSEYKKQLLSENRLLKEQVEGAKRALYNAEVMNGRKQVALPNSGVEAAVAKPVPVKPTPVKPAPVKPAPVKPAPVKPAPVAAAKTEQQQKQQPKKQQKKGGAPKNQPAKPGADAAPVDVSRLDMRVALIVSARRHPDADGLYLEEVDCGEEKPRQVISGLVKHIPIEEMQNRPCILMCNLKPAKMRGIMSHAMVMCASTPEKVEILTPPPGSKPGDRVTVEGFTGTPDEQLNPKKKVFEAVQPDFLVSPTGQALYKGVPWKVNGAAVTAPSMRVCGIK